jgi:hypothetical protein
MLDLVGTIVGDGQVTLEWSPHRGSFESYCLLAIRTGARPGYTALKLDGGTFMYRLANLGRHQRPYLAPLERLVVMPQDRRLTVYWQLGAGFVDKVIVELRAGDQLIATYELEPEVRSFTIDAQRCRRLANGTAYTLTARARFALADSEPCSVVCTPAPQGLEREANREHPQAHLVYPCLSLAPEVDVFGDGTPTETTAIVCGRCRGATEWRDYTLRCKGCKAEFIANQRGDYLDVSRLRFGTCTCCLPRKLLVQDVGSETLRCAHSGKEHIRAPGRATFMLIEDLPFGLCQCCRPRRPLAKTADDSVRCTKSNELHRRSEGDGAFVLVPSAPIFDAAAIDELLDAGLADINAGGVSRGRR